MNVQLSAPETTEKKKCSIKRWKWHEITYRQENINPLQKSERFRRRTISYIIVSLETPFCSHATQSIKGPVIVSGVNDSVISLWHYQTAMATSLKLQHQKKVPQLLCWWLRSFEKEKQEAMLKVISAFMLGVLLSEGTGSRERAER